MIILTKKKILYVIGIIVMFVFLYTAFGINIGKANKIKNQTIQTAALPVNNKVIVIDAGHGVPDERG